MAVSFSGAVTKIIFAYLVGFWTFVALLKAFASFLLNPRTYFTVKERPLPPRVLQEGWNHAIVSLSNIKLHYVYAGDSGKPLMLFVHGFPEFWYSWRHQLRDFEKDYRVVAVDLRGYGGSDKPHEISAYKISALTNDIKELIAALDYTKCILVAHDWGGVIAWQVAAHHPDIIDRLIVLNCPHFSVFTKFLLSHPKQLLMSWYMFFFQCPRLPELIIGAQDFKVLVEMFTKRPHGCRNPNALTQEDLEAYKFVFSQPGALTGPINYYRGMFTKNVDTTSANRKKAHKILPPTLLLWGVCDWALSKQMAELSIKECENGSLVYIENASHWVQQDAPDAVNRNMRAFLSKA